MACRITVEILALAHERACEAELAGVLEALLEETGRLPDMAELRARFAPNPAAMPDVTVAQPPLEAYEEIATMQREDAA
jgi:hypothetical protein